MAKTYFKGLLLATFLCAVSVTMNGQNLQEVVYLKNGGVIRGLIIEQKPNESLKIQTVDGNVFVYKMDEVDKITKEMPLKNTSAKQDNDQDDAPGTYGWGKAPRYRGFFGESYVFGTGGDHEEDRNLLYTSHGLQINPFLYAGVGLGINYWVDSEVCSVPIFAHLRSEFHMSLKKNVSPYIDAKIGYSVADVEGFYFTPSVGCHFYFGHSKVGLSVGLGYVLQKCKMNYYDYSYNYLGSGTGTAGGLELTVALDI